MFQTIGKLHILILMQLQQILLSFIFLRSDKFIKSHPIEKIIQSSFKLMNTTLL